MPLRSTYGSMDRFLLISATIANHVDDCNAIKIVTGICGLSSSSSRSGADTIYDARLCWSSFYNFSLVRLETGSWWPMNLRHNAGSFTCTPGLENRAASHDSNIIHSISYTSRWLWYFQFCILGTICSSPKYAGNLLQDQYCKLRQAESLKRNESST